MQLQALRPADKIIHFIKYIYDQGYQDIPRGFILYVKTRDKASLMRLGSRSWGRRRRRRGAAVVLASHIKQLMMGENKRSEVRKTLNTILTDVKTGVNMYIRTDKVICRGRFVPRKVSPFSS